MRFASATFAMLAFGAAPLAAQRPDTQYPPGMQSSPNVKAVFHVPLNAASDIRIDQELSRPFVFQPHGRPAGFHILDVRDPAKARIIYSWEIDQPTLHQGGASGIMLFK